MFNPKVLAILFSIAVTLSSCLQQKVDRANQAAADIPPVCRQYQSTSDYATCLLDPAPYQLRHDQLVAEQKTIMDQQEAATVVPSPTAISLPPTQCQIVVEHDTISGIVIALIEFWPWDNEGLPSGTLISVKSDFNKDGVREEKLFTEEMGIAALPGIFPGDEVCVAPR